MKTIRPSKVVHTWNGQCRGGDIVIFDIHDAAPRGSANRISENPHSPSCAFAMDELQNLRRAFECCFRDLANHGLVPRPDNEAIDAAFVLFVADMARGFPSLTERRQ